MFSVLVLILSSLATTLGFGTLAFRLLFPGTQPAVFFGVGEIGLFGIVLLTTAGTALNFLVGFSPQMTAGVCVVGLLLCVVNRRILLDAASFGLGLPILVAVFAVVCKTVIYFTYRFASAHYDTGLYHLQSILQINDGPVIIGQANLHMRFGYNSLWFVLSALLKIPGLGSGGAYAANPVFEILITLGAVQRAAKAWRTVGFMRSAVFGTLTLLVFLDPNFMLGELGTPNTDVASNSLAIYAVFLALFFSDAKRKTDGDRGPLRALSILLVALVMLAATVKLAVLPIVGLIILLPVGWQNSRWDRADVYRAVFATIPLGVVWLARGIATSGCLAYPSPRSCLPVAWRVNLAEATRDMSWIRSWARTPEVDPDLVSRNWNWIGGWLADFRSSDLFKVLVLLMVVTLACIALHVLLRRTRTIWAALTRYQKIDSVLTSCVAVFGLIFWFVVAPLPRYGAAWLTMPLLLVAAHIAPGPRAFAGSEPQSPLGFYFDRALRVAIRYRPKGGGLRLALRRAGLSVDFRSLTLLAPYIGFFLAVFFTGKTVLWLLSSFSLSDFPNIPTAQIEEKTTKSGLVVHVPTGRSDQCWDAPRPCTPYFVDRLRSDQTGPWHVMTIEPK